MTTEYSCFPFPLIGDFCFNSLTSYSLFLDLATFICSHCVLYPIKFSLTRSAYNLYLNLSFLADSDTASAPYIKICLLAFLCDVFPVALFYSRVINASRYSGGCYDRSIHFFLWFSELVVNAPTNSMPQLLQLPGYLLYWKVHRILFSDVTLNFPKRRNHENTRAVRRHSNTRWGIQRNTIKGQSRNTIPVY